MKKSVLNFVLMLAAYLSFGQCGPYAISTTPTFGCTFTISLSGAAGAGKIVWQKNGAAIDSAYRGPQATTVSEVFYPYGIFIDISGNMYVSVAGDEVYKIPANGGSGTTMAHAGLNAPQNLWVDRAGNLYVCDMNNNRIQKFPPNSNASTVGITVAGGNIHPINPRGVYIDSTGNIYVADGSNDRVVKFPYNSTSDTIGITIAGGNPIGTSPTPNTINVADGVAVDRNGYIYVADQNFSRIQKFPPGSTSATNGVTIAGGGTNHIGVTGVFVDSSGYIYVNEGYDIKKFPPNSTPDTAGVIVAGNGLGNTSSPNSQIFGFFVDREGSIYIDDTYRSRIQKWTQPPIIAIDTFLSGATTGTYIATITDTLGCISSDTIIIHPYTSHSITQSICQGDTFSIGGHLLYSAGTYYDTLNSVYGCDSMVTLTLTVNPRMSNSISINICPGSVYNFGGHTISIAGVYIDTFTSSLGCDSIVTLTLNVYPHTGSNISQSICRGTTYTFSGTNISTPGIYHDTLTSTNGCDSINTLMLSFYPETPDTIVTTTCAGNGYTLGTHTYGITGVYADTLAGASQYGCDSVTILYLGVISNNTTAYFSIQPSNIPQLWYALNQSLGPQLSYVWNWGDGTPNSTGTTPSHTYAAPGYYDICVTVTDSSGCTATYCDTAIYMYKNTSGAVQLDVVSQIPTGINTITANHLETKYYAGAIHFSEAITAPSRIRLYDMSGRIVMEQDAFSGNKWNMDQGISPSVYIIHLENDSYSVSRKIMIAQ